MNHEGRLAAPLAEPNSRSDRGVAARVNNFLTLCLTHAEVALEVDTREELGEALRHILAGARELTEQLHAERRARASTLGVGDDASSERAQPSRSQEPPTSVGAP